MIEALLVVVGGSLLVTTIFSYFIWHLLWYPLGRHNEEDDDEDWDVDDRV